MKTQEPNWKQMYLDLRDSLQEDHDKAIEHDNRVKAWEVEAKANLEAYQAKIKTMLNSEKTLLKSEYDKALKEFKKLNKKTLKKYGL